MKQNKTRKVFLENLPKKILMGRECVDWKNSIGYKVKFIYDDVESWIEIIDYITKVKKVVIKYKNKEYKIYSNSILNCNLGHIVNKHTKDFKIEIGTTFKDNKRDLIIIDRKYIKDKNGCNKKWYKYHCNKCGFDGGKHYSLKDKCYKDEHFISESELLRGGGCACCSSNIVVEGINNITTTAPWMISIVNDLEFCKTHTCSCSDKIYPICPNCGFKSNNLISINNINKHNGVSCKCSDGISYPNKFMFNLLEQLGIEFKSEYSPKWIKPKRYDFYIPSMNLIVEMDGALGHGNLVHSKSNKTLEQSIQDDKYKDKMAIEHGLQVIRINCNYNDITNRFEYIKENTINKLNKIFYLTNVDWNKINKLSCSSLLLKACELKRNNPKLTTGDIGKILKHDSTIIKNWLIIGNDLNLCTYVPKMGKRIEIFKDGISLGVFESAKELDDKSESLFNVHLNFRGISSVITGRKKHYKGYSFKEIFD